MPAPITITLPDGQSYEQPTGLFIGNDFVEATGEEFISIDPQ